MRFPAPPTDRRWYCVVGSPIAHSRSPEIHAAFAAQTGRRLRYDRVEVPSGGLRDAVAAFHACGGAGLNVTVPLKEEAWALAARRRPRAQAAGAVNTLWFGPDGALTGDNTDGIGLVRDLADNHGVALAGRRVLLIGAGGAGRGVLPALADARPAALVLTNRTAAKAAAVVERLDSPGNVSLLPWGTSPETPFDVIVNATSLSLEGAVPALGGGAVHEGTAAYDMMYAAEPTPFMAWARAAGAGRVMDGLGMLVEQAGEAFRLWHGVRPRTRPVIEALRRASAGRDASTSAR